MMIASGCAGCTHHLSIHLEVATTGEPVKGATVEFLPPMSFLPPPRWSGKTGQAGDLKICVDLENQMLVMTVLHEGSEYGMLFGSLAFGENAELSDVRRAGRGEGPDLRFIVRLVDKKSE